MGTIFSGTQDVQIALSQAMGADAPTADMAIRGFKGVSIQVVWSGADATTGIFVPEVSNDRVNWCSLVSSNTSKRADAPAGCCMYDFNDLNVWYVRINFLHKTNTTGSFSALCLATGLRAEDE